MPLSASAKRFLWTVVSVAAIFSAAVLAATPSAQPDLVLVLVFCIGAVVAGLFPVQVTARVKFTVDTAVYFAAVLLLPVAWAMWVAAFGSFGSGLATTALKGRGKGGRTIRSTVFNTSQLVLAVGLAAVVFTSITSTTGPSSLSSRLALMAAPVAGIVMYAVNTGIVSAMVALQRRQPVLHVWLSTQRVAALEFGALFIIGVGIALLSAHYDWGLVLMALPLAIVLVALQKTVELNSQTVEAVEAMADVVDAADPYTYEHSKRVADYSVRIARELGLPATQIEAIRQAARVHDLGKVGVPNELLRKRGRLTPQERQAIEAHVTHGYEILSRFPDYREGRDLVLRHHERYDGKGYPTGVRASRLSLHMQVMPVADSLDAMTSDRPYRPAMTISDALAELNEGAGTQWHPDVVAAAVRVLERDRTPAHALAVSPA